MTKIKYKILILINLFVRILTKIANTIKTYVFPPRCIACYKFVQNDNGFCSNCFKNIIFIDNLYCLKCGRKNKEQKEKCIQCIKEDNSFDIARSLFVFDNLSKNAIHEAKYYNTLGALEKFAEMLCNQHQDILEKIDLIIPVPMHYIKRIYRSYNPAHKLAKSISLKEKKTFDPFLLKKIKITRSQINLTREERKKNLHESFKIEKKNKILGKNILLVDDVMTTGTTVNLCSKLLKNAGAKRVTIFTISSL